MNQTEDIKELVAALAKAQSKMQPAKFNRINPHFKSRYADFTSCMDACREPLSQNGLAVIQYCETINEKLVLVTMLAHISGQWIKSHYPLISLKMDSQGIGSAMTYAKRYSLCGMIGIVADEEGDDDGETAVGRKSEKLSKAQVQEIRSMESKLDQECKDKLKKWLKNICECENIEDAPSDSFKKVHLAYANAVKYLEQEVTHG